MKPAHGHFKLYKPFGMLSQLQSNDLREQRSNRFLTELHDFPPGIMPIGRLDKKSEGLLLMTTDGSLSDFVNRTGIEKEYYAQLDGLITQEAVGRMREGVDIGVRGTKYRTKPCEATILSVAPTLPPPDTSLRIGRHRSSSWVRLVLREGKFRQVRKMTAAVGYPTLRLIRMRIGPIHLGDLLPGAICPVSMERMK